MSEYIAVTYDVCEHNNLFIDMNDYPINTDIDINQQVKELAKKDVAPIVRVYKVKKGNLELYEEYRFEESMIVVVRMISKLE